MSEASPVLDLGALAAALAELPDEELGPLAARLDELRAGRPATTPSPYLTVEEAAAYLRCSRQHVYDLCSEGRLPRVKDGARLLLARSELDAYLSR